MPTLPVKTIAKSLIPQTIIRYRGKSTGNQVSLTFDDGPVPGITEKVIEILKARGHSATFFLVGRKVESHYSLARQITAGGFEVGNHTYSHRLLTRIPFAELAGEVARTDSLISKFAGATWFRPPGGQLSLSLLAYLWLRRARKTPLLWSICVLEEHRKTREEIVRAIRVAQPRAGDIILLHDDHPAIIEALPLILDLLEERELRSVSISELLLSQ